MWDTTMTLKVLENAAMRLPSRQRAKLAASLLSSLDADAADVERMWIEEAERRYRAYRLGQTAGIPARQAIDSVRAALRKS
jgi:hypothetical protein